MITEIITLMENKRYQVIINGLMFRLYKRDDHFEIDFSHDAYCFFARRNFKFENFKSECLTFNSCIKEIKEACLSINY